ncbi:MAG: 2-oxoacid:ferredoxin oxidoreductase subunit beta [Alphaproteobacteria bacterium]|nr:2-oxoacid:ferredoxin oxidoreductase subunit beta [Alphaproteobacteria bacterium]MCB9691245.1 2-oxoacid:ferredoxin oxidoreductase subunit beta [Alphaproteobacteria bacterium]
MSAQYKKKDFMSDQLVRWCPGCGDYAILSQVQTALAELGRPPHEVAVISGIGCSSRFPYYMNTYGFHTLHGRAPAFATGLKLARPELSVWVITGDGDALSIGGNHLIHLLRRNVDLNVLLFNNRIYGLTKGQYSPTSEVGKKTKSSPMGSLDAPFNPLEVALGAGATYVARSVDIFTKHLKSQLVDAEAHRGTSFVEIYQNCNIFNDGAFTAFTEKAVRDDRVLYMEPGKPLVWGATTRYGLAIQGLDFKAIEITDEEDPRVLRHDPSNKILAHFLARLDGSDGMPVPVGLFYRQARPTYDSAFADQVAEARQKLGNGDLASLIDAGDTWEV